MLVNTADESGCRGVLITHKLLSADRQSNFSNHKTTSCVNKTCFSIYRQRNQLWDHLFGRKTQKGHEDCEKKTTPPYSLKGISSLFTQCCKYRRTAKLFNHYYCTLKHDYKSPLQLEKVTTSKPAATKILEESCKSLKLTCCFC